MYSIKRVSELLHLPATTIRAWETRYGIIAPVRTDGGHRLYSEQDIGVLRWLLQQMGEQNIKISEAVALLQQKEGTAPSPSSFPSPSTAELPQHNGYPAELIDRLYGRLLDLDGDQAHGLIDFALSLYPYPYVFHHILTPVLYRIGEQWEAGAVTVAQEHFASELFLVRFHQVFRALPVQPRLPRALAFCPEGEHHHIGLMLFSLFLRGKGMEVVYLGPNTPYGGLEELIRRKNISYAVVSANSPKLTQGVQRWMSDCAAQFPSVRFVLGGKGFHSPSPALKPFVLPDHPEEWEAWFVQEVR